ncbi:3267_t:CDS:1, partial [Acaulospora morrowiae]
MSNNRRKLSFRSKETSYNDSANSNGGSLSNGINSVRGSIQRLRRVSGATTPLNPSSNSSAYQETGPSQSSAFLFPRIQSIASIAREQTS